MNAWAGQAPTLRRRTCQLAVLHTESPSPVPRSCASVNRLVEEPSGVAITCSRDPVLLVPFSAPSLSGSLRCPTARRTASPTGRWRRVRANARVEPGHPAAARLVVISSSTPAVVMVNHGFCCRSPIRPELANTRPGSSGSMTCWPVVLVDLRRSWSRRLQQILLRSWPSCR